MHKIEFKAMGCQMLAAVDSEDAAASAAVAQVPAWFEQWEQSLSRFRADSDLSKLNRRSGHCVPVSKTLWEVLSVALTVAQQTEGIVIPTLLPALLAAGYDRSFDQLPAMTDKPANPPSPTVPGEWRNIELRRNHRVCLPAGVKLDFGGVAKGWAAQQAVRRLQQYGPALVDAGGDIAISGSRADGSKWPIGVASPFAPDEELELLMLERGGVATSGRDYRRWQQGGVERHHIIDPRNGQPAATDVMSATVIAKDALAAEVAAKVAFILGSGAGMQWLERHPNLAGLLVLEDGSALHSSRLAQYLWR